MTKSKGAGIRCPHCGCRLDYGERCDCERIEDQRKAEAQHSKLQEIIAHNMEVIEHAMHEWDWS